MIKKLLAIVLVGLISLVSANQTLEAQEQQTVVPLDNWVNVWIGTGNILQSTNNQLVGNTARLTLEIPKTNFHVNSIGGQDTEIVFLDADDVLIDSFNLIDFTNELEPGGIYEFDLQALGVENAQYFAVIIAQSYGEGAIPAGYIAFMNENSFATLGKPFYATFFVENQQFAKVPFLDTVNFPSDYPTSSVSGSEFMFWATDDGQEFEFWKSVNQDINLYAVFSGGAGKPLDVLDPFSNWGGSINSPVLQGSIAIPTGTNLITIYLPRTARARWEVGSLVSDITINVQNEGLTIIPFRDLVPVEFVGPLEQGPNGLFVIDLEKIIDDPDNQAVSMFLLLTNDPGIDQNYIDFMNKNTYIEFTMESYLARFWVGSTLFASDEFTLFPEFPLPNPTPPSGFEFVGWTDNQGNLVEPNLIYDSDINFFARFRILEEQISSGVAPSDPQQPVQPTPANQFERFVFVLNDLGFNSEGGFLIFFSVLIIATNLAMVVLRFPAYGIIIIDALIGGIFIFAGLFEFWSSFLFMSVLILGLILVSRRMITYD